MELNLIRKVAIYKSLLQTYQNVTQSQCDYKHTQLIDDLSNLETSYLDSVDASEMDFIIEEFYTDLLAELNKKIEMEENDND